MKSVFKIVSLTSILLLSSACWKEKIEPTQSYSFFVAGHTYGMAGVNNEGLHPPFEQKFDFLNSRNVALGILTGDIVKFPTEEDWDEVDSVLNFLDAEIYFAVGNHDMKNRELYERRYGSTYYSFIKENDLFVVLDPNLDSWNISGEQLKFLKETLLGTDKRRNLFVFFHQLLWWDKNNKYKHVRLNSTEGRADTINFWTEIIPLFTRLKKPVTMYAGDMGAGSWSDSYMYDTYENITFIGSGMGYGEEDNIVITNVNAEGYVDYELIAINGDDIHVLGELEDYELPTKCPEGFTEKVHKDD